MSGSRQEAIAGVEGWLREHCRQTIQTKTVHIFLKICELILFTYRDTGQLTCHPGRQYLGGLVGWEKTKVSRQLGTLIKCGALQAWQPRAYKDGVYIPLTNEYTVPILTPWRLRWLARLLGVDLRARMPEKSSHKKKESLQACVQTVHQILQKWKERGRAAITLDLSGVSNPAYKTALERFGGLWKPPDETIPP